MTFPQLDFVTYTIGCLSERLGLSQPDVYDRLQQSGILSGYIIPAYPVLHTFSGEYLTDDIVDYMKEKGVLQ
ncbi:MAG: DUF3791 domain-containing protein [Bacteroidaceae bacterium]|nr:DUF3791 domain-containing protein [Bacteroidaceae bacterium]